MKVIETGIEDLFVLEPSVFPDGRGYFFESYNENRMKDAGLNYNFVQDNQSYSSYGTLRGLHLQQGEHAQAKLVRAVLGKVLDVVVDLRPDSKTFGKTYAVELSADNHRQLMVPRGFGHGFSVLSETAIFQYKVDNFYNKESEAGIIYNDSELGIDWGVPEDKVSLSEKDKILGSFADFKNNL